MKTNDLLHKALITTEDLSGVARTNQQRAYLINSLMGENRIKKIKNGLYATLNPLTQDMFANRFEIATALHDNCWVSYHSALEFHGLGNQLYSEVHISCQIQHKPFEFDGLDYRFVLAKTDIGVMSLEQNSKIRVTDLERTIVDCLDRIDLAGGLEEVFATFGGLTYLNEGKLIDYLRAINKNVLYKKAGYILSMCCKKLLSSMFFDYCRERIGLKIDDITENKRLSYELNKEWRLIVPTKIINMEN